MATKGPLTEDNQFTTLLTNGTLTLEYIANRLAAEQQSMSSSLSTPTVLAATSSTNPFQRKPRAVELYPAQREHLRGGMCGGRGEVRAMFVFVEEERKIALSGHGGTGSELRNLSATSIQSAHRLATSRRPNLRPSFFAFARCCSPPPNQSTPPPCTPKQCAHQTLRVSLHDVRPCFDWHSRRRSNALCIAPFLLSGTSPSILPYFPARPPPTEPQCYETTLGLSGHLTPRSVHLEPFHPPIGLNAAFCAPHVGTLIMKENIWSFSGDDFSIQKSVGQDVVRCHGQAFSWRDRKVVAFHNTQLIDATDGTDLCTVKKKFSIGSFRMIGFFDNPASANASSSSHDLIGLECEGDCTAISAVPARPFDFVSEIYAPFFVITPRYRLSSFAPSSFILHPS
ncbi:uncharacterized protein STEHIDRAFT_163594 [Stereum hirsutum FP-91666 SS1]|uniref:Uncharacterized protein n=1 Tax=Stereum hirsutum (strain FP-91666) TaxID=721885 RepID=R7RZ23_STEHR|nr:uncharacterized protein STEHIDRAFT_163594 [Stereum hirsutum FP-91666 SS1]EIM79562.1 hypothetical protein STEHIDRAFT_163594 [Stereum hirsutum FP-91666 SS1]